MKKRLQYAMPRIPLRKLKQGQNNQEVVKEDGNRPATNVGAIARRIVEARKGRGQTLQKPESLLGGDIEDSEEESDNSENETHPGDVFGVGAAVVDTGMKETSEQSLEPNQNVSDREHTDKWHRFQHLNMEEGDVEMLKRFEQKLQKQNSGKKLSLVIVGSEGEMSDNKGRQISDKGLSCNVCRNAKVGSPSQQRQDQKQTDGIQLKVQAEIHQPHFQTVVPEYSEENAAEGGSQWNCDQSEISDKLFESVPPRCLEQADLGGAKPKILRNTVATDQHRKGQFGACKHGQEKNRKAKRTQKKMTGADDNIEMITQKHGKIQHSTEAVWGCGESSESEAGWDCDDIPLLPR